MDRLRERNYRQRRAPQQAREQDQGADVLPPIPQPDRHQGEQGQRDEGRAPGDPRVAERLGVWDPFVNAVRAWPQLLKQLSRDNRLPSSAVHALRNSDDFDLARQAGAMLRKARQFANAARDELRDELGPDYSDLELRDLDPRNIVRKHIMEAMEEAEDAGPPRRDGQAPLRKGEVPPYDLEAWVGVCDRLVAQRGESAAADSASRGWASGYSWDRCAKRHFEIYRQVLADLRDIGRARQRQSPGSLADRRNGRL